MRKCLVVAGGILLGDFVHMIPILNRICSMGYEDITLITGTYERIVSEFLKNFYPISKIMYLDDGHPTDLNSRKQFLEHVNNTFPNIVSDPSFDCVFSDIKMTMDMVGVNDGDWSWGKGFTLEETYLPDPKGLLKFDKKEEQIVVQGSTLHSFKKFDTIKEVNFPLPVVTIGAPNEYLFPNSKDLRGHTFLEVAQEMMKSCLFVGIHSSCTCLAFYLNIESVICHPSTSSSLFRFDRFRDPKRFTELLGPTKNEIEGAIRKKLYE